MKALFRPLGVLVVLQALVAQNGPLYTQPAPPTNPVGVVTGVVRERGSERLLERVRIAFLASNGNTSQTVTDVEGKFTIQLAPGSYRATFRRQIPSGIAGVPIVKIVAIADKAESKLDLDMPQLVEVSGHVRGASGQPLVGASVSLFVPSYEAWSTNRMVQTTQFRTQTNDQGEYLLADVPHDVPFYILAETTPSEDAVPYSQSPPDIELRRPITAPTYYPSSTDPAGAQPVIFKEGERRENLDIQMVQSPSYCVEGIVVPRPTGTLRHTITVAPLSIMPGGMFNDYAVFRAERSFEVTQKGETRVCGLWPGRFRFGVQPSVGGAGNNPLAFFGNGEFTISGRDIKALVVKEDKVISLKGEVVLDGPPPAKPVEGQFSMSYGSMTRDQASGYARANAATPVPGPFELRNIREDHGYIRMNNIPQGWYIKSMLYGSEDISLNSQRFVLGAHPDEPLRITLSQKGAKLNVKVNNPRGEPMVGAYVVVARQGLSGPSQLFGRVLKSYSNDQGEASVWTLLFDPAKPTLPPGNYYVMSAELPFNLTADILDRLWITMNNSATTVTLKPGETTNVTISPVTLR